jgi:hypothetical protein
MRRKIHGVFGIIEGVNVQIDFDPITLVILTRAHTRNTLTSAVAISIAIRITSLRQAYRLAGEHQ